MEASMIDALKISVIRNYLVCEFPSLVISDFSDEKRKAHCFRLDENGVKHCITITIEFFLFHPSNEAILSVLQQWKLAEALRHYGKSPVQVTSDGIRLDDN
jgi:hypothetical protein